MFESIKKFFAKVVAFFSGDKIDAAFDTAAKLAVEAGPFIDIAASIVTGLTPTTLDDRLYASIKAKFPKIFDGTLTPEEAKLYMLGVASELLKSKFPSISTTIARAATQAAFAAQKYAQ